MAKRINVRRHKYGAKPTEVDGIRFASQKEAKRYQELKLLERAGEIKRVQLQPEFLLKVTVFTQDSNALNLLSIGTYRADFAYYTREREYVVEDVKGFKTPLYRWKKKHVEAQYGIQIHEV